MVREKFLNDSVALIEFAIEEFGRAVILRDMLRSGLETIERHLWYDHEHKYNAAFTELPKELKTIWEDLVPITGNVATAIATSFVLPARAIAYGRRRRSGYVKGKEETVSPKTRCDAVFIDYDEIKQKWKTGIKANQAKLELIIGKLRERIKTFKV